MTNKKLIERMRGYLGLDRQRQRKKIDKIKALLKKLRKRRKELEAALETEKDPDRRKRLERDLRVLREQRKKGLQLVKKLREEG